MSIPKLGVVRLGIAGLFLLAILLVHGGFSALPTYASMPRPKILSLEEKAHLPYVFVGVVEAWGAESARKISPGIKLSALGEGGRHRYALIRVDRSLRVSPNEVPPLWFLVQVYPEWFADTLSADELVRQQISGPSEDMFRARYLGKKVIFFGSILSKLEGAPEHSLKLLSTTPYALLEPMQQLPKILELINK
jgi:hypothetical protein